MNYSELYPFLSTLGHPGTHSRTPLLPTADVYYICLPQILFYGPGHFPSFIHFSFLFNLTFEITCSETHTVEGSWDVLAPQVFQTTSSILNHLIRSQYWSKLRIRTFVTDFLFLYQQRLALWKNLLQLNNHIYGAKTYFHASQVR